MPGPAHRNGSRRVAAFVSAGLLILASAALGTWSGTYDVSAGAGDARNPQLAADTSGAVTAVWAQTTGGGNRAIYASRYIAGAWTTPVALSTPASDNDYDGGYPAVAARTPGEAIAVWARYDGSKDIIEAATFSGGTWTAPQTVSSGTGNAFYPRVAIDAGGRAIAVWEEHVAAPTYRVVKASRFSGSWSTPVALAALGNSSGNPSIAMNASGDAVAGWSRANGSVGVAQVRRFTGGAWGPVTDLTDGVCCTGAGAPKVALNDAGIAFAVWQSDNVPNRLEFSRWNGLQWGGREVLEGDIQGGYDAQVAVDEGGAFTVAWRGSDGAVRAARRTGPSWSETRTLNGDRRASGQVALSAGSSLNAIVAWTGYRDSDASRVLQVSRFSGGSWSTASDLVEVDGNGGADSPRVVMTGSDIGTIAWSAYTGTKRTIRATTDDGSAGNSTGDTPTVSLASSSTAPLTGEAVTFTATATTPAGVVSQFEWDLDGDGTFETSGSASRATAAYSTAGDRTVTVRATAPRGQSTTASTPVTVYLAPPSGEPAISINGARPYTNTENVSLRVVWPPRATSVRISNDGGFGSATTVTRELAETYPWALDNSIKVLHTKIVYARFSGLGIDETKTYTDDIVLDLAPPEILEVRASTTGQAGADSRENAATPSVRVQLDAEDRLSGVASVQVTDNTGRPGPARDYARLVRIQSPAQELFVRVQDGAGNWSGWEAVRVGGASCNALAGAAATRCQARGAAQERLDDALAKCSVKQIRARTRCIAVARARNAHDLAMANARFTRSAALAQCAKLKDRQARQACRASARARFAFAAGKATATRTREVSLAACANKPKAARRICQATANARFRSALARLTQPNGGT